MKKKTKKIVENMFWTGRGHTTATKMREEILFN